MEKTIQKYPEIKKNIKSLLKAGLISILKCFVKNLYLDDQKNPKIPNFQKLGNSMMVENIDFRSTGDRNNIPGTQADDICIRMLRPGKTTGNYGLLHYAHEWLSAIFR